MELFRGSMFRGSGYKGSGFRVQRFKTVEPWLLQEKVY
jgi:hypothetical protein